MITKHTRTPNVLTELMTDQQFIKSLTTVYSRLKNYILTYPKHMHKSKILRHIKNKITQQSTVNLQIKLVFV